MKGTSSLKGCPNSNFSTAPKDDDTLLCFGFLVAKHLATNSKQLGALTIDHWSRLQQPLQNIKVTDTAAARPPPRVSYQSIQQERTQTHHKIPDAIDTVQANTWVSQYPQTHGPEGG